MSRVEVTQETTPLSDGILKTDLPLDGTLQVVKDQLNNSSTLLLATDETQVNSVLRINTDASELLDLQDTGSNNRFNINRDVQKINLDFASKPSDLTTQVGSIRTAIDGTNLSDAVKFQENGQVTFTERVKVESDSTVTTQTSAVIEATTTNSSIVLKPNGTGAIIASVPDGTATGGNARGTGAVDLQQSRSTAGNIASGNYSTILGGQGCTASGQYSISGGLGASATNYASVTFGNSNTNNSYGGVVSGGQSNTGGNADYIHIGGGRFNNTTGSVNGVISGGLSNTVSSNYSTISGGQSNTSSTNTHATVVGGLSNTSSGAYSVSGGQTNTASSTNSVALGGNNTASGIGTVTIGRSCSSSAESGVSIGYQNTASGKYANAFGVGAQAYLQGMQTYSSIGGFVGNGEAQSSVLVPIKSATLTTAATTVLSLDGTGTTNLIIPNGNNRAWNVTSSWVAVVTAITGTATGITVGDVVTSVDLLGFKRVGGISSASAHTSAATKTMVTTPAAYAACAIAYTAGASQEMALTFTGPTFVGGGSVTMRVVARIELSEVAW